MYGINVITPPASEPVDTALLKQYLRLNTSYEDTLLSVFITSARETFERLAQRTCLTTTYQLTMDSFPKVIRLPFGPLLSVTSLTYYDSNNELQTLDPSLYSVDNYREPGRILPTTVFPDWLFFPNWPALSYVQFPRVIVEFVAGWTTDTLPTSIKRAIMLLAAHFFQHRAGEDSPDCLPEFINVVNQFKSGWVTDLNPPLYARGYAVE